MSYWWMVRKCSVSLFVSIKWHKRESNTNVSYTRKKYFCEKNFHGSMLTNSSSCKTFHFHYTRLLRTTFSSGVVYWGSGVWGFCRAGSADPVQLVFSTLHPSTQTFLEGTAVCRQSWGYKECVKSAKPLIQLCLNTKTFIYPVLCTIFHSLGKRCHLQQQCDLQWRCRCFYYHWTKSK